MRGTLAVIPRKTYTERILMKRIFLTHTTILTILVLIWELIYFQLDIISMLNIPGTEIRIFGLITLIMTITINILSIKKLSKNNITESILKLTTIGTLITLIAFISLQILSYCQHGFGKSGALVLG
jgi:hypothetical protein